MKNNEQKRIEEISDWYLKEQLDFDKRLIRFRYQTLKPHCKGPEGLELGPAEGHMTQFLLQDFTRLTVVDGAAELLACIPDMPNLVKVHALFEEFKTDRPFNTIIMEHILEHVEHPVALLLLAKKWLAPGGRLLVGVPNGHSIHRLVAVKMGLLKEPCELNQRDQALGHRRVYTPETLRKDIEAAQLRIIETGGVFFKPLSNRQIQDHWTEEMIQGFYELGKDFPENAAEIYAVCELP
jgi:2-polyprenyl-3-methyl-5-hydroxy-6-metoxy-1,4-benzoquinol methylase